MNAIHLGHHDVHADQLVGVALDQSDPYQLICMDIMMPEMDGIHALKEIRALEESKGVPPSGASRIFMTTALDDVKEVIRAFKGLCDSYLIKPIETNQLLAQLHQFELLACVERT